MITKIYTDAGYTMGKSFGRLAYKIENRQVRIETVDIPHIPKLKQYTNLLELMAVLKAIKATKKKRVLILTDSRCICVWVKRKKNNLGQFSKFHKSVKANIDKRKNEFQRFNIEWIPREQNLAGIALEN